MSFFFLLFLFFFCLLFFFFLMIRRPPRSTLDRSSAASDVYKRQLMHALVLDYNAVALAHPDFTIIEKLKLAFSELFTQNVVKYEKVIPIFLFIFLAPIIGMIAVSYTHLRAHETVLDIVCRLLLETKKNIINS